jgi:hypothetical protein
LAHFTLIKLHAEKATEFFIICEHDPSTLDKLLDNALDFIGYDRIMNISKLGKAGSSNIGAARPGFLRRWWRWWSEEEEE